ncbi:hypothetical protein E2C01_059403 [Portunus trituberculatus]|uniref:Uncharacterized protein n=1 Tax=Portunus trituberculatus TaxID=210409 RepID=A0A5B7GZ15_PORTR|nr:hypothetical protein [Portunus trituberculatus]
MKLAGDMGPNMGTTLYKIACATNGRKLNNASHILFKTLGAIGPVQTRRFQRALANEALAKSLIVYASMEPFTREAAFCLTQR